MSLDTLNFHFTVESDEGFFVASGHLNVRTRGWWLFKRKKLKGFASLRSHGKKQKRTGTGSRGVTMTMTFNGAPERHSSWYKNWTVITDERDAILEALAEVTMEAIGGAGAGRFFSHTELYGHAVCSLLLGGGDTPDGLDGREFFRFIETGGPQLDRKA